MYGSSPGKPLGVLDSPNASTGNVNTEQYSSAEANERQRQFSALKEQQRTLKLLQEQRKREEELKAQSNSYFAPSTSYPRSEISLDKALEPAQPQNFSSPGVSSSPQASPAFSFPYSSPNTTTTSNLNSFSDEQSQSNLGSSLDTQLMQKLSHFMRSVEMKLDGLDRQMQQLTLDFKLNNTKQERSCDLLNGRMRELEEQINALKVSTPPAPTYSPSTVPSFHGEQQQQQQQQQQQSYRPPPPQNSIEKDEEYAKQLQAELDREAAAASSAPHSSQPPVSSTPYHHSAHTSSYATPGGPSSSSFSTPNTDEGSGNGVNSCPICGVQLPVKQLHEHIEFQHFQNENRSSSSAQGSNPNQDKSQQNEGFFSKLFGGKKQDAPPSSELRPPSYVYGQKPMPVQSVPPQAGSVPPGAVVPYGYPAYNPQTMYRNPPPPGNVPYYNGGMYVPK